MIETRSNLAPAVSMSPSISPDNEEARLEAVQRYDVLDTPPDEPLDRIAALAARLFQAPVAGISIVDRDRIWFKSRHGFDVAEVARDPGLCASAILSAEPWIVRDAENDVRARMNPLVVGAFGLRFYVGVPLTTRDGFNLGTLCVIDRQPRQVDPQDVAHLRDLAAIATDQLELRLAMRQMARNAEIMTREIDHRVMNSLQFVASLLNLQSRRATTPETTEELKVAATRVAAVARVHRHFYARGSAESVEGLTYLQRLCRDLSGILQASIAVEGTDGIIPTSQIVPIGLLVNELITNAVKHGAGRVEVTFTSADAGHFLLTIADEGPGLPAGFDATAGRGLGMKVITSLVAVLKGRWHADRKAAGRGTVFSITFPKR
jgi:two-component sensor histidine kinase